MLDDVNTLHKLQHLDLSNFHLEKNRFQPHVLLSNLQQLRRLTLRCGKDNHIWRNLAKGVSTSTALRHLELVGGTLSESDMSTFCHSGLHACATLQVLEFRYCRLNNAAVKTLAESWPTTSNIAHLDLSGNLLRGEGAVTIIKATVDKDAMHTLILSRNRYIRDEGLSKIGSLLPHVRLRRLDLNNCRTEVNGDANTRAKAETDILHGVRESSSNLREVNVLGNLFLNQIVSDIEFYCLRHIGRLDRDYSTMSPALLCNVLSRCASNSHQGHRLLDYFLHQNVGLFQKVLT